MSSESSTIRWDRDEDGIVVLTLDDPNQSANTMNAAYKASMSATVDRLEAEKDEIAGVVITSAKKTFFAGGDLNDLKLATKEQAAEIGGGHPGHQARLAPAGDPRQARGRGDQRRRPRRRPGDLPGLSPPDRGGRLERSSSGFLRSSWGCFPAPAAWSAPCGCSASSMR